MDPIGHVIVAFIEDAALRGTILRARLRVSLETIVTAAITALAIASAVGYQVLRFRHPGDRSERP